MFATRIIPRLALFITSIALLSCSGGGSDAPLAPPPPPAPVAPNPFPGVTEFLNLDLNNPANYANPVLPAHYAGQSTNTPSNNPVTDRGATLGRVIFYDKRLSVNGTTACATCHQQAFGFSDPKRFSTGVSTTSATTTHAMRLGNVTYYRGSGMFWDKRAPTLEAQASQQIESAIEHGFDAANGGFAAVLTHMRGLTYYPELFKWAFGDDSITQARVEQMLAQFQRAMISIDSKWDRGVSAVFNANLPDKGFRSAIPSFTAEENRGLELFVVSNGRLEPNSCADCHMPPTFALTPNSRSNGLDEGETQVFKSSSLKNIALSTRYMHDGRFSTLEEVSAHYGTGVKIGPALDGRFIFPQLPLDFPQPLRPYIRFVQPSDRAALVAFMNTLTDTTLTTDPKFSDPFKK